MWFISYIGLSDRYSGAEVYDTHCVCGSCMKQKRFAFNIILQDSVTGETAEVHDDSWEWSTLRVKLEWYKPYGLVYLDNDEFLIVTVDAPSVRFLDFIRDVTVVWGTEDVELSHLIWLLKPTVSIIGKPNWCVDYPTQSWNFPHYLRKLAFSLFHVMCFLDKGWHGEYYYLRASSMSWYRVEFHDYHKARAFISKFVFNGYNPINGFDIMYPSLVIKGAF